MYSIDNECLVCNAYQFGTPKNVRAESHCFSARCEEGPAPKPGSIERFRRRSRSEDLDQSEESSAVISLTADLASPKSIEVFGSK